MGNLSVVQYFTMNNSHINREAAPENKCAPLQLAAEGYSVETVNVILNQRGQHPCFTAKRKGGSAVQLARDGWRLAPSPLRWCFAYICGKLGEGDPLRLGSSPFRRVKVANDLLSNPSSPINKGMNHFQKTHPTARQC
jgi:hypothetical protein